MSQITFFQQQRADGGIRSGIDLDGETIWHHYQPGRVEEDAALVWFIDVRALGKKVPADANDARMWLLEQTEVIEEEISEAARAIDAGIDGDAIPREFPVFSSPKGTQMTVVVTATRRASGRDLAGHLRRLARHWRHVLAQLEPAVNT